MDPRDEPIANEPGRMRSRDLAPEEEADELRLLRAVVDLQGDAVWLEGEDGRPIYASRGCESLFGAPRDRLFGGPRGWLAFVHPSDRPAVLAALARLRAQEEPETIPELRVQRSDGTTALVQASFVPQPGPRGGLACSLRAVARVDDERVHRVLDHLFVFAGILTPDGILLEVNSAGLEAAGRRRADVVGRPFAESPWFAYSREVQEQVRRQLRRAADGETVRFDVPNLMAGDRLMMVDVSFAPLVEHGKVVQIIATGVDVTARKRAEEAVQKLNAELEARVRERTAELAAAQEALVRKERLATLGQLTATISHELRNPLGTMRLALHSLRGQLPSPTPAQHRLLERLERGVSRCDHIIDELLDYTRIRDLARQPTPVDGWLQEILDDLSPPTGVTLRRRLGCPGVRAAIDPDLLRRAVLNVTENAFQAMHTGGTLDVSTRTHDGMVELSFADTGSGIPPDVLGRIFEPLFSTRTFGVGLGLPVVRRIVEKHGGRVEIASRVGVGTTVALHLPSLGNGRVRGAP